MSPEASWIAALAGRGETLHGLRERRELASRVRDAEKPGEFPLSLRLMRKLASALSQPVAFRHGLPEDTLMTRSLTGKVALVTGAAKGIGAGIAKAMAAAGASVVVNFASDRTGAERVAADIKAAGGNASRLKRMSPLSPRSSI